MGIIKKEKNSGEVGSVRAGKFVLLCYKECGKVLAKLGKKNRLPIRERGLRPRTAQRGGGGEMDEFP